jgi:putative flavoprotein involved in K+ transport
VSEQAEVIVVGGGQAGLTAGYYLTQAKIPFVILHADSRVGDSWRERWDSLTLFTPALYSALPGLRFPGDPEHYPGKDAVADYLERYAHTLELPIRYDSPVSLEPADSGYRLQTPAGVYEAERVIIATGAYQRAYIPSISKQLSDAVTQLHSAAYRNPDQLPARHVLVVGAANSGAQIAEDLAPTHTVRLSQGARIPRLPRRVLGKSVHWYGDHLGLIAASLDSLRGRTQRGDTLIGTSLRQLKRHYGVELVDRTTDAHEHTVTLKNGRELEVEIVIWATGYRPDYSWIRAPVLDPRGAPIHRRGVTDAAGLYFLGIKNQYSRGSSLLHWVREDAEFIVKQLHDRHPRRGARR